MLNVLSQTNTSHIFNCEIYMLHEAHETLRAREKEKKCFSDSTNLCIHLTLHIWYNISRKNKILKYETPHLQQGVRFDPDMPQTIRLEFAKSNTKGKTRAGAHTRNTTLFHHQPPSLQALEAGSIKENFLHCRRSFVHMSSLTFSDHWSHKRHTKGKRDVSDCSSRDADVAEVLSTFNISRLHSVCAHSRVTKWEVENTQRWSWISTKNESYISPLLAISLSHTDNNASTSCLTRENEVCQRHREKVNVNSRMKNWCGKVSFHFNIIRSKSHSKGS